LGPAALTAMMMSLEIRVKVLAMLAQRFIFRFFRYSNARPMLESLSDNRRQIYNTSHVR
jgi:hypothetical protein